MAEPEHPETLAIAETVVATLLGRGETLAVAESLTGGLLGGVVTAVPGSSQVFLGGVVSYATEVKVDVLGVPQHVVDSEGVVSAECARAMAEGVRKLLGTTYALSTTGVAGPETQEGEPVGRVYVGLAGPSGTQATRLDLDGERAQIREQACAAALSEIMSALG